MPDPLRGILSQKDAPTAAEAKIQPLGPKPWPYIQPDHQQYHTAKLFDNDVAIEVYEENLEDLKQQFGNRHAAIPATAEGLAVLYETKAGLEKQAEHYDRAIEYLELANSARVATFGEAASQSNDYLHNQARMKYIELKKEKRLAKVDNGQDQLIARDNGASRVVQVHVTSSSEMAAIEFYMEDGTDITMLRSGSVFQPKGQEKEADPFHLVPIKDDTRSTYDASTASEFTVEAGDALVGVVVMERAGVLTGIQFQTQTGVRSKWYRFDDTGPRGTERRIFAKKGYHIVGLATDGRTLLTPVDIVQGQI